MLGNSKVKSVLIRAIGVAVGVLVMLGYNITQGIKPYIVKGYTPPVRTMMAQPSASRKKSEVPENLKAIISREHGGGNSTGRGTIVEPLPAWNGLATARKYDSALLIINLQNSPRVAPR